MKKVNLLFSLSMVILLLWGTGAKAQVQLPAGSTLYDLYNAVTSLSSTGGTIVLQGNLSANLMFDVSDGASNATSQRVVLTSLNPITINCGTNRITATCTLNAPASWDGLVPIGSGMYALTIGSNITVTGSGSIVMESVNRGCVEVANGGEVISTAGGVAINNTSGRIFTQPGSWVETQNGGVAVYSPTTYTVMLRGGTIKASGTNAVGVKYSQNPGTAHEINTGTTIIADGVGVNGILISNTAGTTTNLAVGIANSSSLSGTSNGATIKTSSPDNSDIGINVPTTNINVGSLTIGTNVNITSSKIYAGTNATWLGWVRNIAANPVAGPIAIPSQISLSATLNDGTTPASEAINYGIDADPSTVYSSQVNMTQAGTLNTNITVTDAANNNTFATTHSFIYTEDDGTGNDTGDSCDGPVTSFAELQAAYNCSQTQPAGTTTTIEITKNFTITSNFTMTPDADHPVIINMDTSFVTGVAGVTTTFGGTLTINSPVYTGTSTSKENLALLIGGNTTFDTGITFNDRIAGGNNSGIALTSSGTASAPVPGSLTINGGTYTSTAQGSLIYLGATTAGGTGGVGSNTLIINGGIFNVATGATASANIRAIQSAGNNGNIIINSGTFNVGTQGYAIYCNGGNGVKATIIGGSFTVVSNATSYIVGASGGSVGLTVEIDGGSFDINNNGYLAGSLNTSDTQPIIFVLKAADKMNVGHLINNTNTVGNTKFYDFRGYSLTPSITKWDNGTITVSLGVQESVLPPTLSGTTGVATLNSATGLTADAINYYTTNPSTTNPAPATINFGETLNAYVTVDGTALLSSKAIPFIYDVWQPQSGSTAWTDASNWTNGVPDATSTAFIPSSASYPVLTAPASVAEIHFGTGAQIGGQSNLTGKAFVQYDFGTSKRARWNMLSIPLMQVYPADFTFGGYPQTWVRTFTTSTEGSITEGVWTTLHNSETPFSSGDGFVIWLNGDDNTSYPQDATKGLQALQNVGIWELPSFQHYMASSPDYDLFQAINQVQTYVSTGADTGTSTYYNIVNSGGQYVPGATSYNIDRDASANQLANGNVEKDLSFLSNDEAGGSFALVGNPYMAALDFDALYANTANASAIKPCYQVWTDNGTSKGYVAYTQTGYAGVITDNSLTNYIAPLQAFLVENPGSLTSASLQFTEGMTAVNNTAELRSSIVNGNKLDIIARNPVAGVLAFIAKRDGGQDEFGNMDARKIINGITDVPEIYTLKPYNSNSIAVGANVINNDDLLIPIGLATSYTGNITLSFSGMDSYDANLSLIDAATNKEIDLTGLASYDYTVENYAPKTVNNTVVATDDRFFIRISKTVTGLTGTAIEKANVYESNGFIQIVSEASNPVKEVEVYNQQGALIYKKSSINTISYTVDRNLPVGAYIVKVISEKTADNVKVIVK